MLDTEQTKQVILSVLPQGSNVYVGRKIHNMNVFIVVSPMFDTWHDNYERSAWLDAAINAATTEPTAAIAIDCYSSLEADYSPSVKETLRLVNVGAN